MWHVLRKSEAPFWRIKKPNQWTCLKESVWIRGFPLAMKVASVSSPSVSVSVREKHRLYLSGLEKDKEQVHLKYVFNREHFPGSIYTGGHFPKSMLGVEAIKMLLLTKILALNLSINTVDSPLWLCEIMCSWNHFIHQDIKGPWWTCAFIINKEKFIQVSQFIHTKTAFLGRGRDLPLRLSPLGFLSHPVPRFY